VKESFKLLLDEIIASIFLTFFYTNDEV